MNVEDVFLAQVLKTEGCWIWTEAQHKGYGRFYSQGKTHRAHRWSYTNFIGEIPSGLVIDHLCRNTLCVRPDHLEAVTQRVNSLRGDTVAARYAARDACDNGHEFTSENTKMVGNTRRCLACGNARSKKYQKKGVTPGLTHGKKSTYDRGCRCTPCRAAKRAADERSRSARG